jgi:hypothetical protein
MPVVYSKIDGSALRIVEGNLFDNLFSCLYKWTAIPVSCKSNIIVILENGVKGMVTETTALLKKQPDQYRRESLKFKNALKMYMYLLQWFISEAERTQAESGQQTTATGRVSSSLGNFPFHLKLFSNFPFLVITGKEKSRSIY